MLTICELFWLKYFLEFKYRQTGIINKLGKERTFFLVAFTDLYLTLVNISHIARRFTKVFNTTPKFLPMFSILGEVQEGGELQFFYSTRFLYWYYL